MIDVDDLGDRLARIRSRIRDSSDRDVAIVGVTKGLPAAVIDRALAAGVGDIGENYAQELIAKAEEVDGSPRWHFIGRIQRNKVRRLVDLVSVWHTVDRIEVGDELARRAPGASVMVQVNVSAEPTKGGCRPEEVAGLVEALHRLPLAVDGLMTVGAPGAAEDARPGFRLLRSLADDLGLAHCSMGMSADYLVAVEEGSTCVRLGTVLFGPRPSTVRAAPDGR